MSTVRRFRIVAGKHHTGKGITYKAGDILESTRRLDKIFINKFVEVSDATPVNAPADPDSEPIPERPQSVSSVVAESDAKVAALEKEIARQANVIALMKVSLEEAEATQQKLEIATKELDAASVRIEELEKQLKAAKKPAKGAKPEGDPFDKE